MTNNVTRLPTPSGPPGTLVEPHDLDAERQVLGAMLTSPRAANDVIPIINGTDFWSPAHETIYDAIAVRALTAQPVDPLLIADDLGKQLDRAGGQVYLHELAAGVITTANAAWHADIIRARSDERRTQRAALDLVAKIQTRDDTPLTELIDTARDELARIPAGTTTDTSTWEPINLAELLDADNIPDITATIGPRRDGQCLLYPAAVHSISGEPGSGKTWFAQVIAAHELKTGRPVLYIDFEDRPTTIIGRLRALGCTDEQIRTGLRYIRPDAAMTPAIRDNLSRAAQDVAYAVIDGITEAMTMHGLSLMDNEDVARWLHLLPRRLADLGAAVLQIDHVVKNSEQRGRYAIGGQHKLAGIDGVAYKILVVKPFGKGTYGRAKLVIDKDRHGDIGPTGSTAADLHIDGRGDQITGWLDDPTEDHAPDGTWRPTGYMEKIARVIEANPGVSTNAICAAVRGKKDHIKHALAQLVTEGNVRVENGARGSANHYLIQPFAEAADDQF